MDKQCNHCGAVQGKDINYLFPSKLDRDNWYCCYCTQCQCNRESDIQRLIDEIDNTPDNLLLG